MPLTAAREEWTRKKKKINMKKYTIFEFWRRVTLAWRET
jgi:hypothetical protein